jgi:phosphoenolpyruvate carboxykinase (ATP)
MLSEAIAGNLDNVEFATDPVFGVEVPTQLDGVPTEVLVPRNTWADKEAYDIKAKKLAEMFIKNFEQFSDEASDELLAAAPKV